MLVKCASVLAEGCAYVISGNQTITPVSLRVDYIIGPLSKRAQFNLKDIIFQGAAILIKQGE